MELKRPTLRLVPLFAEDHYDTKGNNNNNSSSKCNRCNNNSRRPGDHLRTFPRVTKCARLSRVKFTFIM
jgi:hypothetical protein